MTRRGAIVAGVLVAGLAAWAIARRLATPTPSDEEQIETLFREAIKAAEEKRVSDAVAGLSERFQGDGLDKRGAKRLIAAQVYGGGWVAVTLAGRRIEIHGDTAEAVVDLLMARSGSGGLAGLLPSDAAANRITCRLEREAEGWRVVEAKRRPLDPKELLQPEEPPR